MKTAVSKRKLINLTRFHLLGNWQQYISMGAVLLINFIVAVCIGAFGHDGASGGSIDFPMLCMSTVFGVFLCVYGLKFALINGVSRKTYVLSSLFAALAIAVVYALATCAFMAIAHTVGQANDLTFFLYLRTGNTVGHAIVFEIAAFLFTVSMGWFAALLFYRLRKRGKLILLAASAGTIALLTLIGFFTPMWSGVFTALKAMFGFNFAVPNPFVGAATFFGLSAVILTGCGLLCRRIDLR